MRYVNLHTKIPIMADESLFSIFDALNLIENDAAPYFNVKFTKSGGIHNTQQIIDVAKAGAIPCMIGCMSESKLGITAAAHFALANKTIQFFDLDSFFEHAENPITGGVQVENGFIEVPDSPGIGAEPDPAYIKRLEEIK